MDNRLNNINLTVTCPSCTGRHTVTLDILREFGANIGRTCVACLDRQSAEMDRAIADGHRRPFTDYAVLAYATPAEQRKADRNEHAARNRRTR